MVDQPLLPVRPQRYITGVIQFPARCDPKDIIANRLDPWHGVHFHPHSFARLKVIDKADDVLTVRVVFRALKSIGVEVDCTFHCPEPNTIVMTIIEGEGKGSVVEFHFPRTGDFSFPPYGGKVFPKSGEIPLPFTNAETTPRFAGKGQYQARGGGAHPVG